MRVGWRRLSTESAGVGEKWLWLTGLAWSLCVGRHSVAVCVRNLLLNVFKSAWRRYHKHPQVRVTSSLVSAADRFNYSCLHGLQQASLFTRFMVIVRQIVKYCNIYVCVFLAYLSTYVTLLYFEYSVIKLWYPQCVTFHSFLACVCVCVFFRN